MKIRCQNLSNLLSVVYFVLCFSVLMMWPHKICAVAKLLSSTWKWAWGDTLNECSNIGMQLHWNAHPTGENFFHSPLEQHGHAQLVSSRADHRTGVPVAKLLPPQCRMNKLGGSSCFHHRTAFCTPQLTSHPKYVSAVPSLSSSLFLTIFTDKVMPSISANWNLCLYFHTFLPSSGKKKRPKTPKLPK